ncbi:MAG: hypothetical protein KDC53_04735 [Saprospiraceae bacterium]|nr:hypothetical protein [Saprospiraceae bacterium]
MIRACYYLSMISILSACEVSPQAINYEIDQCSACKMTISDPRFGAELITTKGKIFKFDAIECMVPELLKSGTSGYSYILATDYNNPGVLVEAQKLYFLISREIPSPMGGFLSAYSNRDVKNVKDIMWYNWPELLDHFQK